MFHMGNFSTIYCVMNCYAMIAVKFPYDLAFSFIICQIFLFHVCVLTLIWRENVNNELLIFTKIAESIGSVIIKPCKEERREQQGRGATELRP